MCMHACNILLALVSIFRRVIPRRDHQTPPLARARVHRLHDVDELLLIVHRPVHLVVVPCPEIDLYVLVPEEEHHRARVVQLVHGVKIGHLRVVRSSVRSSVVASRRRQPSSSSSSSSSRVDAYLRDVHQVYDGKVFNLIRHPR